MSKDGVGDSLYSGASDFGKFSAIVSGVIGTLFALIFVGFGIYLIVEALRRTKTTQGKITLTKCPKTTDQNRVCDITVSYTSDQPSKMCTAQFTVEDEPKFAKGKEVTVFLDPSEPCVSGSLESQKQDSILGIVLLAGGLLFICILWLIVYLTYKYKFFAASEGVGTVLQIV
uniref:Uncharacterized protein n=1 Tax=Pithovirus LCPAC304 TaxID=2506594 RepID=A0A481Z9X2_9VIRU|nr:MAG: protein of unknown function DUF3592 [Pithovirus LCPAC304]